MSRAQRRIDREKKTVSIMIEIYCDAHHERNGDGLCADCSELQSYALERFDRCPFCLAKPTCKNCPIHCYRPSRREDVREVMRYAGPRMMRRHPWLAITHLIDDYRKVEAPPARE